jgi:hypothetical protein
MKKLDGTKLDGQFLFAQISKIMFEGYQLKPLIDVEVPGLVTDLNKYENIKL